MTLTERQKEVAVFVAMGKKNKEIAERLFVSEKTIKFHIGRIYKALGFQNRQQLIEWTNIQLNKAFE